MHTFFHYPTIMFYIMCFYMDDIQHKFRVDEKIFYKANAISIHKSWVALQLYWAGLARSTSNVTAVWLAFLVIFLKMFMKTATPNHQYRFMEQCEVLPLSFQCYDVQGNGNMFNSKLSSACWNFRSHSKCNIL